MIEDFLKFIPDRSLYTKIDERSPSEIYIGQTQSDLPSPPTNTQTWDILRIVKAGTEFTIQHANGSTFSSIWDNHITEFPPAPFNNSLATEFDGINDYVNIPTSPDFSFERSDPCSYSFWARTPSPGSSATIISKEDSAASFLGSSIQFRSSKVRFILRNTVSTNELIVDSGFTIGTDLYQHFCITYDGGSVPSSVNFYRDAIVDASPTTVANTLSATTVNSVDMRLGARMDDVFFYGGKLDEFSIFNRELTAAEVLEIRNAGVPNNLNAHSRAIDLITWWQMGDFDTFPIIGDKSIAAGFGTHNGTMINMSSEDFTTDKA